MPPPPDPLFSLIVLSSPHGKSLPDIPCAICGSTGQHHRTPKMRQYYEDLLAWPLLPLASPKGYPGTHTPANQSASLAILEQNGNGQRSFSAGQHSPVCFSSRELI